MGQVTKVLGNWDKRSLTVLCNKYCIINHFLYTDRNTVLHLKYNICYRAGTNDEVTQAKMRSSRCANEDFADPTPAALGLKPSDFVDSGQAVPNQTVTVGFNSFPTSGLSEQEVRAILQRVLDVSFLKIILDFVSSAQIV